MSADEDWRIGVIRENSQIFAHRVGASSVVRVAEFSELPVGSSAIDFAFEGVEFRFVVPDTDPEVERAALLKEIDVLTDVIDKQLDVLDPDGAGFLVKSRNWYRRKKRRADAADPASTLLCCERTLHRLRLLKRLKQLDAILVVPSGA